MKNRQSCKELVVRLVTLEPYRRMETGLNSKEPCPIQMHSGLFALFSKIPYKNTS